MKELSFLMFMVGLFFGLSVLARRLTNPNHPDRTAFFIPSPMLFNVLWGSIFYIGYGILMFKTPLTQISLAIIEIALLGYTIWMHYLKHVMIKRQGSYPSFINKILNKAVAKQEQLDASFSDYSQRKALKILGLPIYAVEEPDKIRRQLNLLKAMADSKKISSPYLQTIIKRIESALKVK